MCQSLQCQHLLRQTQQHGRWEGATACLVLSVQIMVRRESEDASALMLFRKKADVAPVDPLFFPAPPANTSNEVRINPDNRASA